MTIEECQHQLLAIRRRQGTRCPLIRIDCGGAVYRGRLTRSDSDPEHRLAPGSPSGIIALQDPGLGRASETILRIADIHPGALRDAIEV